MGDRRQRRWQVAAVAAVAALGLWVGLRDSEADRIEAQLERFCTAVAVVPGESPSERCTRIRREFARLVARDAVARIPDAPGLGLGRAAWIDAACGMGRDLQEATLTLEQPSVRIEREREQASVTARVVVVTRPRAGELRTDTREGHARLRRSDGAWRLVEGVVTAPSRAEPEPRP